MKPRIQLTIVTKDSISTSVIKAPHVTNAMYDAAWDLVYTLSTNKRRKTSLYTQDQKKKAKAAVREAERKRTLGVGGRPLRKLKKRTKRTPGTGNADGTGIHSMVEGNRDDHQT